jgi:hypothetical protein
MNLENKTFNRVLVVRISENQYLKLLEAIISENKKGVNSNFTPLDKSKIIRNLIEKYGKSERVLS